MTCRNLDSTFTLASAKALVDSAVAKGRIVHFYGHDIQAAAAALTWATSDLAELLDYILSKNLPVITMDDYYNLRNQDVTVE